MTEDPSLEDTLTFDEMKRISEFNGPVLLVRNGQYPSFFESVTIMVCEVTVKQRRGYFYALNSDGAVISVEDNLSTLLVRLREMGFS